MRGYPGSGKSTKAKELAERFDAVICSADDYFMKDGNYKFNVSKLKDAHQQCQDKALNAINSGKNVIVDNTNLTIYNVVPYIDMILKKPNWLVSIVMVKFNDIKTAIKHRQNQTNGKNIPYETMMDMYTKFEMNNIEPDLKHQYKNVAFTNIENVYKLL